MSCSARRTFWIQNTLDIYRHVFPLDDDDDDDDDDNDNNDDDDSDNSSSG